MAAKIEATYPDSKVDLVPGGRGDFIVKVDDRLLWDKRNMGAQFPGEEEIISKLGGLV